MEQYLTKNLMYTLKKTGNNLSSRCLAHESENPEPNNLWCYFPIFLRLCRAILNFSPCSVRSITRMGGGLPLPAVSSVFLDSVSFIEHRDVLLTIQGLSSCSLGSSAARTYSATSIGSCEINWLLMFPDPGGIIFVRSSSYTGNMSRKCFSSSIEPVEHILLSLCSLTMLICLPFSTSN